MPDNVAFNGPCFCPPPIRFRFLMAVNVLRLSDPGTAGPPEGSRSGLAGGRKHNTLSMPAVVADTLQAGTLLPAALVETGFGIRNCWPPGAGSRVDCSFSRTELVRCKVGEVAAADGGAESTMEPNVEDFEDAEK